MAHESRRLSRRAGSANEGETIAIVCEGAKTEKIYLDGVRIQRRLATARLRVVGLGADPLRVVEEAESFLPDFDHAWAVFDVEAAGPHGTPHRRLKQAIARAERSGVKCAISHPCFELWLLLHFRFHTAYIQNEAVRAKLRGCGCDYEDKGFDFSKVWPRHQAAIRNARDLDTRQCASFPDVVDRNPWTSVHELILQLVALVQPDPRVR
ncbi:MAG: RloB domain-containing protein [Micromonosporaceae bacterium]|nr:RloB domain-containing protein [Micromonosporaceae bacterium]